MPTKRLLPLELHTICAVMLREAGASEAVAAVLASATVDAESAGQPSVGLAHLRDYLTAMRHGQIDGLAEPEIVWPAPAMAHCDARSGIAHLGFERAFRGIVDATSRFGLCLFSQRNAFTAGSLSWFAGKLAEEGLVSVAATSGPAMMAAGTSGKPVYCTNPLAFGAPVAGSAPLLIDQASTATAYVKVREAAEAGTAIPEGWAVDSAGSPTTDAAQALSGALLAFGGSRGANIALMVEVLAAGLSRASWALDAPAFTTAPQSLDSGLFILAIKPDLLDPDFPHRLAAQLRRLGEDHGVHIPGRAKAVSQSRADRDGIEVDLDLIERLRAIR